MKILFDQCVPQPLRPQLKTQDVFTAKYLGWGRLENGALIEKAEREQFDCLVTTDQNLKYQQNLTGRRIAIFVIMDTDWAKIKLRIPEIVARIAAIRSGEYVEFQI